LGLGVIGAFAVGLVIAAFLRLWTRRQTASATDSPNAAALTPDKRAALDATLKAYENGRLWPPKDVRNPEAWNQYWRNMLEYGSMEIGFGDMMASSPELLGLLKRRNVRRILCVGNGMSGEALSLALFGFDVTALDLSSIPASAFDVMLRNPDSPLVRSSGLVRRDDGTVMFSSTAIDPEQCPRIHQGEGHSPGGGGMLQFVTGDVLDASTCPGPFDAVIERRTLQLFTPDDQRRALHMIQARLAAHGIVVSHQHNGGWRPDQPRTHFAEAWADGQGFVRWRWNSPDSEQASRLADLWYTTG